jgi:para-aminobenzoate synthetase/4-amino-4-deoxychorismate lyase
MRRWHSLPLAIYALVEQSVGAVLLESAPLADPDLIAGDSRLFLSPERVITAWTATELPALLAATEAATRAGLFAAGFFSYECGAAFEPKSGLDAPPAGQPLAWFGFFSQCHCFDHAAGSFRDGFFPEGASLDADPLGEAEVEAEFPLSPDEYAEKIAAIHDWIGAGDVYQLNFTAPYRLHLKERTAALYARLRRRQPAAYGAFLHWQPKRRILSFSPELFFRLENRGDARRITTRPMKGTVARGRTTAEDRTLAEWLHHDEKNRAENLMIVDLLRNDLGRLARPGSVRVEKLFAVERHPTLWQMTSTVTAELPRTTSLEELLRALFPCGSITGAPKIRAMQLLAGLEGAPRGVYTGAIGYAGSEGAEFNVAIRTLDFDGTRGTMGVGGGIVIDSTAESEYRECLLKATFLTAPAPPRFDLIETLLWQKNYPLLDLHLERLADSADYFDFLFNGKTVRHALLEEEKNFGDAAPRKVRLLLDASGEVHVASEPLPRQSRETLRVTIAEEKTDPTDSFLFHKTTHRPLYARVFAEAARADFADALFFNTRGELTEGAISNVFLEKDGRWFTPPVDCGLLDGVYRRHLLAARPDIVERVLTLDDLRTAEAIYLTNAVRGLRRVSLAR